MSSLASGNSTSVALQRVLRINKPTKLKLSATLSALSTKLEIIPTKLVSLLKDVLKDRVARTYVRLILYQDKTFDAVVCEKNHVDLLRDLYVEHKASRADLEKALDAYAKISLGTSYALTEVQRKRELEGTLRSILGPAEWKVYLEGGPSLKQ